MKLNVKAFAFTCALLWGLALFLTAWWVMIFEGATGDALGIGHIYRGFNISPLGSIMGLVWGLVDGLIAGAIFAWLYNLLAGRTPKTPAA